MTPQEREVMQMALDTLEKNKRTHYYCEDTWYSCPKHEDGCANDAEGDDCNCGADRINTVLDKTIKALRARLEQPEQEPVAYKVTSKLGEYCGFKSSAVKKGDLIYTAPPQREWVDPTDDEIRKVLGISSADSDWNVIKVRQWVNAIITLCKEKNYDFR